MRGRPSVRAGALIALVFTLLFTGLRVTFDTGTRMSPDAASSSDVTFVFGAAMIATFVAMAVFGWWGPVRREERRLIGWMWFIPPIMFTAILASTDYGSLADVDPNVLLWTAAAAALVGVTEELVFRGVVLVGLRESMSEMAAYVWSTVAFAMSRLPEAIMGTGAATAAGHVSIAFVGGTLLYLSRRAAGTIVIPMALHGLWNFSASTSGGDHSLSALALVTGLALFVAFLVQRRQAFRYVSISGLHSAGIGAASPAWRNAHRSGWVARP